SIFARRGDWEMRDDVEVQRGETTGKSFAFVSAITNITSEPSGAEIFVDSTSRGRTPLRLDLPARPHEVVAHLDGWPNEQQKSVGPAPGQPFSNSLGMKFVPLGDIQISVWETRVQDYEAFCRATGRHYEPADFHQTATDPAVKVSWFDAMAFCKWLTEKEHNENLIEDRQAYRLPTDLEWSMAVGLINESGATPESRDGKIKHAFPWGKQ